MKLREILLFVGGLLVGAFLFYSLAWRTGALAEGHWLTRRTREVSGVSAAPLPSPLPSKPPVPTLTPTPGGVPETSPAQTPETSPTQTEAGQAR
jgi:hypothetical protein